MLFLIFPGSVGILKKIGQVLFLTMRYTELRFSIEGYVQNPRQMGAKQKLAKI